MNNVTNHPEASDLDKDDIDYMNGVDNESRVKHLVNVILNTAHEKDFTISIDLLMNIMAPDYEDHRSAAQTLLMMIKNVDRYRSHKWQWGSDESIGHVYFSANYPTESELDAVNLHSEIRIQ